VTALGSIGNNLASACYWHPTWPYKSSLTNVSSKALGAGYTAHSHKQWNQQTGASLALFDVAAAALKAAGDPHDAHAIVAAMQKLHVETPIGVLNWAKARPGVPSNVVPTPIPGGQWVKSKKFKVDFTICEHSDDHRIPIGGHLKQYA